jgi:hypothetical protein
MLPAPPTYESRTRTLSSGAIWIRASHTNPAGRTENCCVALSGRHADVESAILNSPV